jgi:hypothetical protein
LLHGTFSYVPFASSVDLLRTTRLTTSPSRVDNFNFNFNYQDSRWISTYLTETLLRRLKLAMRVTHPTIATFPARILISMAAVQSIHVLTQELAAHLKINNQVYRC